MVSHPRPTVPPREAERRPDPLVLLVVADRALREVYHDELTLAGYRVAARDGHGRSREAIQRDSFDVALIDLDPSPDRGMEYLHLCRRVRPDALTILLTSQPDTESSIEALRAGAWDYVIKPLSTERLKILVARACDSLAARAGAQAEGPPEDVLQGAPLGRSPAFLQTLELARRVARTNASVFLTGESGSGKEVIAQLIHRESRRRARPMVAVNCAALPEALLESEMFGHVRGAFSGATREKKGLLEIAHGGTFFLDELTEMPVPLQAKFLRVLQDGMVRRVGSECVNALVDLRLISATNRLPQVAVAEGALRPDLFYRLGTVLIRVPPLRQRVEDVPELASHFLAVYWRRHREPGAPAPRFSEAALQALQRHRWPGNVRELQNVVESMVVLAEPGSLISPRELTDLLAASDGTAWRNAGAEFPPDLMEMGLHEAKETLVNRFEAQYIAHLVEKAGDNLTRAARLAGVSRATLYRIMDKLRHDPEDGSAA